MRSLRNVMRSSCVMQSSPVMHAYGAWEERIASPITAWLHHLSLISILEITMKEGTETGRWL